MIILIYFVNDYTKDIQNQQVLQTKDTPVKNNKDLNKSEDQKNMKTNNKTVENEKDENKVQLSNSINNSNSKLSDISILMVQKFLFLFFIVTISLWIIRIIVKIALSNYHLFVDASERVVMIRTYLSLIEEGGVEENNKNIILNNIFRPTNFGIIKDESAVSITDIISSLKK